MKLLKVGLICAVAVTVTACPDRERDRIEDAPITVQNDTPAVPPVMPAEGVEQVEMRSLEGSDVSGEATLTPDGDALRVTVRLTGASPGQKAGHIHTGTCDNIGPVAFPLEPIEVQTGGSGNSTSTVQVGAHQLMDGEHVIVYHQAAGGAPVTCGQIPQHDEDTGTMPGTTRP